MGGWPAGGTSEHGGPEPTLPNEAVLAQGGGDHRLPKWADNPQHLTLLAHRTTVSLQRAANRMLRRLQGCKMFGPGAEAGPDHKDQVGIQLLFELRATIQKLDDITDLEPNQQVVALKSRLAGLVAMQQAQQGMLTEIGKITNSTNKTLIDLARVSKMEDKSDEDITDAELAP